MHDISSIQPKEFRVEDRIIQFDWVKMPVDDISDIYLYIYNEF